MRSFEVGHLLSIAALSSFASAAPTCSRVASQWTVVFEAKCTQWFHDRSPDKGPMPQGCTQKLNGDVRVDSFPWIDDVVVVDNEIPADDFSLQPEQNTVKYGAGIVVMQTTWDTHDGRHWLPRDLSSVDRVHPDVAFLSTDDEKIVKFDIHVHYTPPPPFREGSEERSGEMYEPVYSYAFLHDEDSDDDDEVSLAGDAAYDDWPFQIPYSDARDWEQDDEGSYSYAYFPTYVYSYEQVSYEFSHSFELEDAFESYSYELIESFDFSESFDFGSGHSYSYGFRPEHPEAKPDDVTSVTSMDVYVCTDEDNNLAELRFYCEPDNKGTDQCWDKASGPHAQALNIHGFDMYCEPACLDDREGGLWCDIFGLNGCRMCSADCSFLCANGEPGSCASCVQCPSDRTDDNSPDDTPAPSLTTGEIEGSREVEIAPPTEGRESPSRPPRSETSTSAPTDGTMGSVTPAPVTIDGTIDGSRSRKTPPPTVESGERGMSTPSPTSGSTGYDTPAPSPEDGSRAFETQSPTRGLRGFETWSPTVGSREGDYETVSQTSGHGSRGFPMMSAAPTAAMVDMSFMECTPGRPKTCYDKLSLSEKGVLKERGAGLTCEESCIVDDGLWCRAFGLNGCRFCANSCPEFCALEGLPADCNCIEC